MARTEQEKEERNNDRENLYKSISAHLIAFRKNDSWFRVAEMCGLEKEAHNLLDREYEKAAAAYLARLSPEVRAKAMEGWSRKRQRRGLPWLKSKDRKPAARRRKKDDDDDNAGGASAVPFFAAGGGTAAGSSSAVAAN